MNTELRKIPNYESYFLTPDGRVYNRHGKQLKPIQTHSGLRVELRCNGQREVVFIDDLLDQVYGGSNES